MWGNQFWLGSRQMCETFMNPHYVFMSNKYYRKHPNLASESAPFDIEYRIIYAKYSADLQIQPEYTRKVSLKQKFAA